MEILLLMEIMKVFRYGLANKLCSAKIYFYSRFTLRFTLDILSAGKKFVAVLSGIFLVLLKSRVLVLNDRYL